MPGTTAVVVAFRGELPQCLAATPLLELVEGARLAISGQLWQRLIQIVLREIKVGDLADASDRRLDVTRIVDQPPMLLFRRLPGLTQERADQIEDLDVIGVAAELGGASPARRRGIPSCRRYGWRSR